MPGRGLVFWGVAALATMLVACVGGRREAGATETETRPRGFMAALRPEAAVPRLIAPTDGASVQEARPVFEWRVPRARERGHGRPRILVQICADERCRRVVQSFRAAGGWGQPGVDLAAGSYYWRAAFLRGRAWLLHWSEIRRLTSAGAGSRPPSRRS